LLEDVQNDLKEMKMKRQRQKGKQKRRWAAVIMVVMVSGAW
jgi:hypothetical protein